MMFVGDIVNCVCIFVDDIIDIVNIIICVVKFFKCEGVFKVIVFVIYGVFSGDVILRINVCGIDKIVVINLVF